MLNKYYGRKAGREDGEKGGESRDGRKKIGKKKTEDRSKNFLKDLQAESFRTFNIFRDTPGSHISYVWLTYILKIKNPINFP